MASRRGGFRGILGETVLNELKHYYPMESTNIDFMHSILYGVLQKLMDVWFMKKYSYHPSSIHSNIEKFDKILLKIRPSKTIPHAPRSIRTYHLWRAHELLAFLLYYSAICFEKVTKFY